MLATINDKKLATDDGNGEVAWYEADVVTANDYYPFVPILRDEYAWPQVCI